MILYSKKQPAQHTIGGKALGLYRLREAGFSVPDFLLIPAEAFDPLLKPIWLKGCKPDAAKEVLRNYQLSEKDASILLSHLQEWGFPKTAVVVRSSVADEDGIHHAFPGMMDSFLNLKHPEDVAEAIALCAASAYGERAMAYRKEKGLTIQARPAIIIQQQVTPESSGVMFTTFPEYPQEMAIHACPGFGEGLVGGKVEADEFYFLKKTGQLHRQQIREKTTALGAGADKGLTLNKLTQAQQQTACLTEEVLQQLWKTGNQLEKRFRTPQDVEFAVQGNTIYLLQARPLTQQIPEVVVFDNSNIQESYCGVTTPLTFSFARRAYATVYRQTMQVLGLPEQLIQKHEPVLTKLLALVKGRIYYNINNWYRGLQLLPSFKQNKEDMERMMGVEEPVDFVEDCEKSLKEKISLLPGLLLNLSRLLYSFYRLPKRVAAFQAHFQAYYAQFYQLDLHSLCPEALQCQKEKLDRELLLNWTTPIINDFYVMMTNGRVRRKLQKAGIENPEEFLSRFLSGDQEIESTQPTKAMLQVAQQAWLEPRLQQLILALPVDLHQQLKQKFPSFFAAVCRFIEQYGDRTVGELKLETHTMRTHPFIFYQYLRNFLHEKPEKYTANGERHLATTAQQELKIALQPKSLLFRKSTWRSLERLRQAIRYRESMRLQRTRLFGMYRALYLAMGSQLTNTAAISSVEDVFYLSEMEILASLQEPKKDLTAMIKERKKEFDRYRQEEVPSRVVIPSPPLTQEEEPDTPGKLKGAGCYPGTAEGSVILIKDPSDGLDVKDKIVCALRTDPGWAALFPACRGVLIEKGSSLSHSVILLRELGIPTIINIPGLTKKLQSGDKVRINSSTGEITII